MDKLDIIVAEYPSTKPQLASFIQKTKEFRAAIRIPRKVSQKNTPAYLLSHVLDAQIDLDPSSFYLSELITNPIITTLIRLRFSAIVERRDRSLRDLGLFQEVHLGNARAVADAIATGERTFGDFMKLLKKSERFKRWLNSTNPDANMLSQYYEDSISDSWIETLPMKALRYVITTGASLINPGAGFALGAADALLLDRIAQGWRPNQFVNGPLKRFVSA